jgi:transcriptional regulator with GAF, ATPase, and Fis domain
MPSSDRVELAETFGTIARTLLAARDVQETLDTIVRLAVRTIDGCDLAGITLIEGRSVRTAAGTGNLPALVDAIQYETGEGPCLDAIREHEVFGSGDLDRDARWPRFASRAHAETGVTSMLGFRLFVEEETMGALNLYSMEPDAFDDEALAIGSVFAAHAGVALSSAREEANLKAALASRDLIGQAKGILMSRGHVSAERAFEELRVASQHLNRKLRDVASDVASTGEMPSNG